MESLITESVGVDNQPVFQILEGRDMQRDDDYLRKILAGWEASPEWRHSTHPDFLPADTDVDKFLYHVGLLKDEDFLEELAPSVVRMKNKAHDFLGLTNDPTIWERAKTGISDAKGASITMLMNVAEAYVRRRISEITGLDI